MFSPRDNQPEMGGIITEVKPFTIEKSIVWKAYQLVRRNEGAAGIDGQSIDDFELNLKSNLFKIWNRMSSGSYFPPAVKAVEIPKKDGGVRILGIPTVADRIAQAVVREYLEPKLEKVFHKDSYGYRRGKSAHDAIDVARKRSWKKNWVIDLDIKGFFDNLDHDLVMKAVKHHSDELWIHLYIERWLKAPLIGKDGNSNEREKGTPQGGVISPLLANLFLHYGFDLWISRKFPGIEFERYADDVVVHCETLGDARYVKCAIENRMKEIFLELHPDKTKIVYCKDEFRKGDFQNTEFDFLGYTFRTRVMKDRKSGRTFKSFNPAMSKKSLKEISNKINSWKLQRWTSLSLEEIGKIINPKIRGWIQYYGKFYKTEIFKIWRQLQRKLLKWFMSKYKNYRGHIRRSVKVLYEIAGKDPRLLSHWELIYAGPKVNGNMGSRMS